MKPKATVGICVRNCEAYIKDTIESILNQDLPHQLIEVIFVDDGSEDGTLDIIRSFIPKMDFEFRIFAGQWRGLGVVRQIVVENANGSYIVWVDGDTVLSKDYVRKQVEFMEKNPNVGITAGKCCDYKDLYSLKNQNLISFLEQIGFVAVDIRYKGKATQKLPGTAGSTYRVKALRQVGGFDGRVKGAGEDIDAAYRIMKANWLIYLATEGTFHAERKETWKALWSQYFWHGYGLHFVFHKNKGLGKLYDMLPPVAFLSGLLYSFVTYKLTHQKAVFLLPFHFVFKTTAWWLGFIEGHLESHGHYYRKQQISNVSA